MRDDVIHHAIFTDSQEEKLYMPPLQDPANFPDLLSNIIIIPISS